MEEDHRAIGLIMITTEPSMERSVFESVRDIVEVDEVLPLFGEFDIYAKVITADFADLGAIVLENIRTIEGVKDTKTLTGAIF